MKIYLLTYKLLEDQDSRVSKAYTSYSQAVREYKALKSDGGNELKIELDSMDVAISVHEIRGKKGLFEFFKKIDL